MMKGKTILVILSLIAGFICTYYFSEEPKIDEIQKEIAGKVLRFHVLANSDSEEDQELKLKVKKAVVDYLDTYLNQEELTLEETKTIVETQKEEIIQLAEQVIRENGYDYSVSARLDTDYFPIKTYGDITLPAGEYEAFCMDIGEAKGKNWWCILYPPLCFVDASYGYLPDDSKEMLKNVLDEECFRAVAGRKSEEGEVEVRFKLWDIICDRLSKK